MLQLTVQHYKVQKKVLWKESPGYMRVGMSWRWREFSVILLQTK